MTVFSDKLYICYTLQCHSSMLEHILKHTRAYSSICASTRSAVAHRVCNATLILNQRRSAKQLATGMIAHGKLHEVEISQRKSASPKLC